MPLISNLAISGDGEHDFGGGADIADWVVQITTLPGQADLLDSLTPPSVARVGFIQIGADVSVDGTTVVKGWQRRVWFDNAIFNYNIATEDRGCRYLRWHLAVGASGVLRAD